MLSARTPLAMEKQMNPQQSLHAISTRCYACAIEKYNNAPKSAPRVGPLLHISPLLATTPLEHVSNCHRASLLFGDLAEEPVKEKAVPASDVEE